MARVVNKYALCAPEIFSAIVWQATVYPYIVPAVPMIKRNAA